MNRDVGPVTAYADAVDGGYAGTRAQFRTLLANLPHGVFIAQYNSTSYDDIKDALDAGLFVVAKGPVSSNYTDYYLFARNETRLAAPYFLFTSVRAGGALSYLMCHKTNGWSMNNITPARTFVATYGDTTYEEVADALANEMVVFAENGDLLLPYVGDLGGGFLFSGVTTDTARTWTLADNDTWTHYETDIPAGAGDLSYSNTTSGLSAYNVQEAIDEVKSLVDEQDVMIVKATATWLGGALTGMSIDSGQTLEQIYSKAFSGANIVLIVSNKMYLAYGRTGNVFAGGSVTFSRIGDNSIEAFTLSRTSLPYVYSWTYGKAELQLTGNLVTIISSDSTDAQYPSAKCVWDNLYALEQRVATIEGGA